jgi:brefeldin A-resistance guanine nucleotide exchange factor 1
MLLVLSNGGYLAPPDEKPGQEEMWVETWKRVNRFAPGFFGELFPEEAGKPVKKEMPIREKVAESEKTGEVECEKVEESEKAGEGVVEKVDEEKEDIKEG